MLQMLFFLLVFCLEISFALSASNKTILIYNASEYPHVASIAVETLRSRAESQKWKIEVTTKKDDFVVENLEKFQAIVFLLSRATDLTIDQQKALIHFIQAGNGFVGIHAANYETSGWTWYSDLIGINIYQNRPPLPPQSAQTKILDRFHPSTEILPEYWQRTDVWWDYDRNPRGKVHVLATVNERTYNGGKMGADHPISWCQLYDGGRVWYTSMGTIAESWSDFLFVNHVIQGIAWASGQIEGDCTATVDKYYEKVVVDPNVYQPMQISIAPDGRVFFIERDGNLKIYKPDQSVTLLAGHLDVTTNLEDGLLGLALDPNFSSNQWVYLYYSPNGVVAENILSRFTMKGDFLDKTSEKILLRIPTQRQECCHSSGGLMFDPQGNLFLGVGDNTSPFASDSYTPIDERPGRSAFDAQRSSSNTNDLRGKILRIHPEPDGTYSIPPGNLFVGDSLHRPEIYIMGVRNPFRFCIDPITNALYWAEVGPNAPPNPSRGPWGVDEINVARGPGNYGWPYCIADNKPYIDYDFATQTSRYVPFDCDHPVNDSPNNNGAYELPSSKPALIWYHYGYTEEWPQIPLGNKPNSRAAMLGPFIRFNSSWNAQHKLPQYFDNSIIFMEWARNQIAEIKFDSNGNVFEINPLWNAIEWRSPIDMKIHPIDGSLYVAEFGLDFAGTGARISRIQYNTVGHPPVCVISASPDAGSVPLTVHFSSTGSTGYGPLTMEWDFELDGKIDSKEGPNVTKTYTIPGNYIAKLIVKDRYVSSSCSVPISVGNTPAVITLELPVSGGIFHWGDTINYRVRVDDAEDGSTTNLEGKIIDCQKVEVQPGLGHQQHVHSYFTSKGCSGHFVTSEAGHNDLSNDLFIVMEVRYEDRGGPSGVLPILSRKVFQFHPALNRFEYFTESHAISLETLSENNKGQRLAIDDTDAWLRFKNFNLFNIFNITIFASCDSLQGGVVEIHCDSPTGRLLGSVLIDYTGSLDTFKEFTAPIQDTNQYFQVSFPEAISISKVVLDTNENYPRQFAVYISSNREGEWGPLNDYITTGFGQPQSTTIEFSPPRNNVRVLRIVQLADFPNAPWTINELHIYNENNVELTNRRSWSLSASITEGLQYAIDGVSTTYWSTIEPQKGGSRDLFFTFKRNGKTEGTLFHLDWFKFEGKGVGISQTTNLFAINSGGSDYYATDGTFYSQDKFFLGGQALSFGNVSISYTLDSILYQTARVGERFSYIIPMNKTTLSLLSLSFCEPVFSFSNSRVFDVLIDGMYTALSDFDIFVASKGQNHALTVVRTILMEPPKLNISFQSKNNNALVNVIKATPLYQSSRVHIIPGRIYGSNYRDGGPGVGYIDTTSGNSGGGCRADDVDLRPYPNDSQHCFVMDIEKGEFLQYDVNITAEGILTFIFSISSNANTEKTKYFWVELDNKPITNPIAFRVEETDTWRKITAESKEIPSTRGWHLLKVVSNSSDWQFDYMDIFLKDVTLSPFDAQNPHGPQNISFSSGSLLKPFLGNEGPFTDLLEIIVIISTIGCCWITFLELVGFVVGSEFI